MRVSVERLLEGVTRTLLDQVLPRLEDRVARGQLYAAIEVLRNLERRADWAEAPLAEEAASAESALRAAAERLRDAQDAALAARIEERVTGWPAAPTADRVRAARATLCDVFVWLGAASPVAAAAAQPPLGAHLAAQSVRDLSRLAPGSLLEEVSRG
jgi:hypothetical protein